MANEKSKTKLKKQISKIKKVRITKIHNIYIFGVPEISKRKKVKMNNEKRDASTGLSLTKG